MPQTNGQARLLAQVVVVSSTFAFAEEDRHAFGHVNSEEAIPVANEACERRKSHSLQDRMICKVLPAERSPLHVELHHEGSIHPLICRISAESKGSHEYSYPEDTKDDEENNLEEMPVAVICDLE